LLLAQKTRYFESGVAGPLAAAITTKKLSPSRAPPILFMWNLILNESDRVAQVGRFYTYRDGGVNDFGVRPVGKTLSNFAALL
jgi:hypothetical protein